MTPPGVQTIAYGSVPLASIAGDLAAAGISRIGVPVDQLELGGVDANIAAVQRHGLQIVSAVRSTAFTLRTPDAWPAQADRLRTALDVAARAGCEVLYTTTGPGYGLTWDQVSARFAEAIEPVVAHARSTPVRLAVENTATMRVDLGFVHTLGDTVALARACGLWVCADLFIAWTDRDLEKVVTNHVAEFALVQLADFVVGTRSTPDRAVPGDGDVPIADQLRWLCAAGYSGPIELELLGPRINAEGPAAANARGLAAIIGLT